MSEHVCLWLLFVPGLLNQIYQPGSFIILRTISHPRPVLASETTKVTGQNAECFSCYTQSHLTWWQDRPHRGNYHITFQPTDIWSTDNVALMGNAYEGSNR